MIVDIKLKGVWLKADIEGIDVGGDASYLVYTAILIQSGTDTPTVNALANTIGAGSWVRDAEGIYTAETTTDYDFDTIWYDNIALATYSSGGGFDAYNNNVIANDGTVAGRYTLALYDFGDGKLAMTLYVRDTAGTLVDLSSFAAAISLPEIRVYPTII